MSDKFVIQGGKKLSGEIDVRGSKNAAGPALIACLLTKEECIIDNVPFIEDILNILDILKSMGVEVEKISGEKVRVKAENVVLDKIDFEKVSKTRISVLFFGALLNRAKKFKLPPPGGDRIGLRPISVQLRALEKMGAVIEKKDSFYEVSCEKLIGKEIVLEEFSVTATESLLLAAVLAEGKTIIKGAAAEPHVQDLGEMLLKMGAKIEGLGNHVITIEGVEKLHGCAHSVIPDPIEAGTFIVIGALIPGKIKVTGVNLSHLDLFLAKLEEMGVEMERGENYVLVSHSPKLKATKVQALPYPGFPTDLQAPMAVLATQSEGLSLIHDPMYDARFSYIQELNRMGAQAVVCDPHRVLISGVTQLHGERIKSFDLRAGATLILAGLVAKGETVIEDAEMVDRGYERFEQRLRALGARMKREQD